MSLRQTLSQLVSSLLLVASQRIELASLDIEEELLRLGGLLVGTLVTALIFALALAAAAMSIVVYFWDTARLAAMLGITGLFATLALAMVWRLSQALRNKPRFMANTLAQLDKDRAPLGNPS
jgi:uncharacterized membrane protein YqjE